MPWKDFDIDVPAPSSKISNTRFWEGICYPESMVDNWQDIIADTLQIPLTYTIHDKDLDKDGDARKVHVHVILAFSNTTTLNHAKNVLNLLAKPDKTCCPVVKPVISVRQAYNYQIHDTEDCRKLGKFQYPPEARILKNGFDIGAYEQIDQAAKLEICREIEQFILDECITNFRELALWINTKDERYYRIYKENSSHLGRCIIGNYQSVIVTNR